MSVVAGDWFAQNFQPGHHAQSRRSWRDDASFKDVEGTVGPF
ncbi:hypothetical protein SF83666_b47790 (plasmid) [Sinorhizobium fredii CCBAU 83666]|nr:hypothetical protein SF83666_b47790 [Sinorhizobium fredii CCBAU 83666]